MIRNPDIMTDSWNKRHSVADPRSNTEYTHESSGHMHGAYTRTQVNRSTAGINVQSGGYGSNLKEDQRSASHYDVKSIIGRNNPGTPTWQESPSRTLSAAALGGNSKDLTATSNSMSSQQLLKKSSRKKEDSIGMLETQSLTSGGSTDTITAEDEDRISHGGRKLPQSTTSSVRSYSERQRTRIEDDRKTSSKPQFRTEEHQSILAQASTHKKPSIFEKRVKPGLDSGSLSKDRGPESRLYSRFEPLYSSEKKQSMHTTQGFGNPKDKAKSLPKGDTAIEHHLTRAARGHSENKFEKFFHRVGNLIHKK
ncbi:hypothetical protein CgunFtcFv8_016443 [Champsocephalus gunnari]|nr:hypothetical protein CgunFtcFv8_016443 [Champsocephalus gunnari]